ncbi:MAG: DUF2784 domain-containing protein [Mycobacterium sp.]
MVAFVCVVGLTAAAHFAYLGYLVVGGFLAWRLPRTIMLHIPAVAWGIASITLGLPCPLTALERWARAGAGMAGLPPEGFIAHYLIGVLYPVELVSVAPALAFGAVLMSWMVLAVRGAPRWRESVAAFEGTS